MFQVDVVFSQQLGHLLEMHLLVAELVERRVVSESCPGDHKFGTRKRNVRIIGLILDLHKVHVHTAAVDVRVGRALM